MGLSNPSFVPIIFLQSIPDKAARVRFTFMFKTLRDHHQLVELIDRDIRILDPFCPSANPTAVSVYARHDLHLFLMFNRCFAAYVEVPFL